MQIHRFRGRTLYDALLRAREEHGETAVVVGHEAAPGGGVTVAVAGSGRAAVRGRSPAPRRPKTISHEPAPASKVAEERPQAMGNPGQIEVRRRLERGGASRELVDQVTRAIERSGAGGTHAIDVAARFLGARFSVAPSPRLTGATHVLAFVGPTGVGKSTTVAKLAGRLTRSGRRVAIASTDVHRPGGTAALEGHAAELGVAFDRVHSAKELLRTVVGNGDADVLLLDTAGRSPLDAASVRGLAQVFERSSSAVDMTAYLVLPATAQKEAQDEAYRGFAPCSPSACIVTKLDETERPAGALEFAGFHDLGIAFLCDGQDWSRHLHRPKAAHFADLLLRGRLG